jgi:hypothetical protein
MKYVRYKKIGMARDVMVTFDKRVQHRDFTQSLGKDEVGVISAGFVKHVDGELICYGESVSLQCKSLEEDTALLNRALSHPLS